MTGYLGETIVDQKDTKFKNYNKESWIMYFLESYSWIDGSDHKNWLLDQIARIIKESPIIIKLAKWENGQEEYRIKVGEPTQEYFDWVTEIKKGEDGPNTWSYDEGIVP
jgi:hypothetical protein